MARVSSDEQAKGFSLDIQKQKLEEYCSRESITVKHTLREDHSAKNFNRPEWKRLKEILSRPKHGIDLLIVTSWDRFSRNLHESLTEIEWLKNRGVSVMAIDQPLDMSVPENKLMLAIYLTVPEVDNDRRSIKIKEGMRAALKAGRWCRPAPKGYRNTRDANNRPIIVPDSNIKWISYAYNKILEGWSQSDILRVFVENNVKIKRNGLSILLRNSIYIGKIIIPKIGDEPERIIDGLHDAIISEDVFFKVQEELSKRKQLPVVSKYKPEELFPLRGFLVCSQCGRKVTASFSRSKSGKRHGYYHCNNCRKERYPSGKVHNAIECIIDEFQFSKGVKDLYDLILQDSLGLDKKKDQKEIVSLSREIEKQQTRYNKLQDLLLDELISALEYSEMKTRCESSLKELNAKLSKLENTNEDFSSKLRQSVHILEHMSNTFKVAANQEKTKILNAIFPETLVFDGIKCRTPRLNSVLELILNIDKGSGWNKKGRTLKNLEFSHLVEPEGFEPSSKQGIIRLSTCLVLN